MPRTKPRKLGANIKMKPYLSSHWSDLFYQRALDHTSDFRMKDIAHPSEVEFARIWLRELVQRGELARTHHHNQTWYRWINT